MGFVGLLTLGRKLGHYRVIIETIYLPNSLMIAKELIYYYT